MLQKWSDFMELNYEKKSIWEVVDEQEHKEIYAYGERYKNFLDNCKTEREATGFIVNQAKEHGIELRKEKYLGSCR